MPATRKEEESTVGGRGGECDANGAGGRRAAGAAAVGGGPVASSGSAYPVADGEERAATSLPMLDSTVHTIYRSPSMGSWMPDSECGASNMSRYSLLPPASVAAATASIQQMESAAAMMKLAYRNRLHDRIPLGAERRNSTPGGDVTGGNEGASSWRMPTIAWAGAAASGAAGAEAPAPLRGEPELPRLQGLRLPLADVCEASVARQRAPRDPSSSSDEGLGLDRQPSLTDLRSLDSESSSLAAALPPAVGRRRPRGLHEQPLSGHRIHQSQSPPHDRLDSLRSSRQMSASSTFHGLHSLPGYTERKGAGNNDAPEGQPQPQPQPLRDPRHDLAGMSPPVDYQMWSNKIVELQQMSDSLTQGIANFIRIATSCDPQYMDAMPPVIPKDRYVSASDNHFSRKLLDSPSPIVTPRTLFSRTGPAVDTQRLYPTRNAGRDCIIPRVSCTVAPAVSVSAESHENAINFERGIASDSPASPQSGSYLYQDQGSIRRPSRVGVGDTVDSLVTIATIPSLPVVELDANEALKRQSAEISGDIGGYRPGVIPLARRQCTGESGDFEPSRPLVNSETTSSVEMGHSSRNCVCKEDHQCAARTSNEVYSNESTTLTLFERTGNSVETCTESGVGVNLCETEENICTDIRIHDSSTTNETPDDSIGWARSVRSETAICSHTSDFVVPDTGINYTFPPSVSGIDEMRSILMKERNVNRNESSVNDKCSSECNDRNVEVEKPVADASEVKHEDGEKNLISSTKNVSGCPSVSSRDTNCEPSYDLEQHFLPSTTTSNEVREAETDKAVSEIDNDVQNEQNESDSKSITSNVVKNNDNIENMKNEHTDHTHIGSSNPSTSSVMFKAVREEGAMENICISTCALKALLSGHGILEDVKEMEMLSTRIPENKEKAAYLNSLRKSTSTVCRMSENEVQPNVKENGWQDALNSETCTPAERPAAERDIYSVSNTSISVKKGDSRAGSVVVAGPYGESVTVLASQREMATSEDRSRSVTPTDCRSIDAGKDDSGSGTTSASTSLFGSVIRWTGAAAGSLASASNSSSASELRAPTNSFEDVHSCSRRSSARYDARETLNLVRDLIWKDSTYTTLRPEHDVEAPSTASSKPGAGAVVAGSEKKGSSEKPAAAAAAAAVTEVQQRGAGLGGVRTVWQPRHHRLRHDRSSQTCVAVREFPNIPATESLQRTVKTTNLKGYAKSPATSPRTGPTSLAARLHQKTSPAPIRSGPTVPGGWPAVSARPLVRFSAPAGPGHGHAPAAGLSRSAGSSPRMPCSAYTREPASRAASSAGSASARDVAGTRSKDASAADALLADAASLFRAKLEACDRKQSEQRRAQKGRPLSAAARLSGVAPAGPPNYLRMARTAASAGRRQPLQESENWHQRQQHLQQRQLQLQQRQQLLQQRQLQLQQRQQMQQRQQLLQRQTRVQQAGSWQQRLNQTQVAKPTRRPASRAGDAVNAPESAPGSASLRMLQARLRAGGSLHRVVVAMGDAATAHAHAHIWPQPEGGKEPADRDLEEEDEAEVEAAECPTRDRDAEGQPESRDLTRPEAAEVPPEAVQPPHTEEQHNIPEAEAHDTHEVHEEKDGERSKDNVNVSQEPPEIQNQNHSAVCGTYTDISSYLNTDFVNVEARVSDLSLLSERCNMRFMNYLPSTPIRERDEEDFFREIMFSGHKEVFKNSYNNLLLPHCAKETQLSNVINPLDRENSDTEASVQSEHLIDPPAEFCTDVKVGGEDKCVASSQSPTDVARDQNSCPTDSTPAPDGPEASHADEAGIKVSCSRSSSVSSILKQYENDTSSNVARTSDLDQLTETIEMTSESDANVYTSDEENAVLSHSRGSGISSTECPSILHSERTLDNNTEGPNDVSEGKPLHKAAPILLCCDLFSIQTNPLTLNERNTACGSVGNNCSPQHNDFQEKCGNDVMSATFGSVDSISNYFSCSALPEQFTPLSTVDGKESSVDSYVEQQVMYQREKCGNDVMSATFGSVDSISNYFSCSALPEQFTPLSTVDGKESSVDSYVEQQVMYQRENGKVRNETSESQDQNNLGTLEKPPFTDLAITPPHEKISNGATDKNNILHKPSIQDSAHAEEKEASTERNEGGNRATALSLGELLSPTSSSEYTDCSQTSEDRVEYPTEDTESRDDPKSKLHNTVQNTSANFPDEQSPSSVLSPGSSFTLLNTKAANDFPINNSIETNTTIQEQCRETIPCAVNDCKPQTEPCLTQDVLIDVTHTEASLIDADVVNGVNDISDNEENSGNIETASQDPQDDDSFRDAVDDTMSIKSLNNDDLTDESSVSDPFSGAQFFSDGDEGLSSPGFGTATSSRLSAEHSINYDDDDDDDDESFNNLCATLVKSHVESELPESLNEELNKTSVDNNASADINGKIISFGTETTSYANESRAPAPETSFTETQDAQRINVVDVVSSMTSWVTVSTSSYSDLPVEEESISSLTASTQNKVGNSEKHSESLSDNRTSIRHTAEYSIHSCQLSGETNVDNNKVESTVEQMDSPFDSAKRIEDAPADEIYVVSSSELSDAENISSLVVADIQSNVNIKDEHKDYSSDSAVCIQDVSIPETHVTPSSELLVEAITSYLATAGAQTILEHVEGSSDNVERIINAAAEETYNLYFSELAVEANISSVVGDGTQNKEEISEGHLENTSDNVTCAQDETSERNVTTFSELPAGEITSSLAVVGAVNILEDEETSSNNARCTRVLKDDEMYAIHSSAVGDEANVPVLVVGDTQNKVEINEENVESSFDNAEHIHCAAREQTHITDSSNLPVEAEVPSPATVDDQTKVENVLDHIETCSDDAERIRQPTACKRDTSKSDATFAKQEDEPCALVSNEEIQEEIPLGEASASWETLSEHSCTSEEDQVDDTRASPASPHHRHQRRRRHRREPQWRPAVAEDELEADRQLYDLVLASPEVEVHLSEALAHSEAEQPLMPPGSRLLAVGGPDAEALAAALAGVALVDADAEAEGATDILYGTRDLHNAAVEAAVACVVDSELRDLSTLYVQRLGGCLLVGGDQRPDAGTQAPMPPEVDTCCGMDGESSPATTPVSELTTPPASPPGLESTSSSCSLHDGTVALAAAAGAVTACSLDGPRSNTIATLLTVCLFLAAYSGCLIIDPNLHLS